jgi:hypothetical protein
VTIVLFSGVLFDGGVGEARWLWLLVEVTPSLRYSPFFIFDLRGNTGEYTITGSNKPKKPYIRLS